MALTINTNAAALNNNRKLTAASDRLSQSLQRLSSGMRVNSAKDDAAGMAIAGRMNTQIRGMSQAKRNANDGISMLQTTEAALESVSGALQRMRELSVQAANSTNSVSDKAALQQEANALNAEIDRIGADTKFNGISLFAHTNISAVGVADPNKQAVLDALKGGWLSRAENRIQQYFGIVGDGAAISIELDTFAPSAPGGALARVTYNVGGAGQGTNLTMQVDMADFVPPNLPYGGTAPVYSDRIIAHEMVHAVMARATNWGDISNNYTWFAEGVAEFIHGADERLDGDIGAASVNAVVATATDGFAPASIDYSGAYAAVRYLHSVTGGGIKSILTHMQSNLAETLDQAFAATTPYGSVAVFSADFAANGAAFIGTMDLNNADTGSVGGFDADGGAMLNAEGVVNDMANTGSGNDPLSGFVETWEAQPTGGGTAGMRTFQVGANAGETLNVGVSCLSSIALGLDSLDLIADGSRGITQTDRALDYVNSERAKLGAQQNRLEAVISTLQTGVENLSAARSRIVDTDFADETAKLSRNQILAQAATAMAGHANSLPRMVLSLLRAVSGRAG